MSERTMAEGIMMCIDTSWRPNEARDWTRPELILAEYVGDLRQRIAALERERDKLAAALEAMRPLLEEIAALSASSSNDAWGYLKRACAAVSLLNQTNTPAILAARDLAQQEKGGREALTELSLLTGWKDDPRVFAHPNGGRFVMLHHVAEMACTWTPRERRGGEAE